MAELASKAIGAASILPEAVAFPALGARIGRHLDELMLAVGESALPFIGT